MLCDYNWNYQKKISWLMTSNSFTSVISDKFFVVRWCLLSTPICSRYRIEQSHSFYIWYPHHFIPSCSLLFMLHINFSGGFGFTLLSSSNNIPPSLVVIKSFDSFHLHLNLASLNTFWVNFLLVRVWKHNNCDVLSLSCKPNGWE